MELEQLQPAAPPRKFYIHEAESRASHHRFELSSGSGLVLASIRGSSHTALPAELGDLWASALMRLAGCKFSIMTGKRCGETRQGLQTRPAHTHTLTMKQKVQHSRDTKPLRLLKKTS